MRLRFSFTRRRKRLIETGSFLKRCQTWSVLKTRYGFVGRVNVETASIWKRLRILARIWLAREQ